MNKKVISIILALSTALSLSACGKKKDKDNAEAKTATNVTVYSTSNGSINEKIEYTGEIIPAETVSVAAKASGTAKAVDVELGTFVKAGTTLLVIDDTDYKLQYNQALAAYNSAVAGYNSTVNGGQKQKINQLDQQLASAKVEYQTALDNYNREKLLYDSNTNLISANNNLTTQKDNYAKTQELFNIGAASQTALDAARVAFENAQATVTNTENTLTTSLNAAKTRLDNAKLNLDATQSNYDLTVKVLNPESQATATSTVASAKATLDIAKNTLSNTVIKAPISGYIASKSIAAGQLVAQGTPLFVIKNTNSVDAEINVTEAQISNIVPGTPATLSVESAGIDAMSGTVSLVNPTKDEKTGMYAVRVSIPNDDGKLKAGMFADITLVTSIQDNIIKVPTDSILQQDEEFYVYVAKGTTAEKRIIVTGITDGEYTEIVTGLSENEDVVVSGKEYISDKNNQITVVSKEGV